eukprot:scaffold80203_cov73-Phaeocystis_antarctica.AAC.9
MVINNRVHDIPGRRPGHDEHRNACGTLAMIQSGSAGNASGGTRPCRKCRSHGCPRRGAGSVHLEHRQRAAVKRSGQGGAAGVGDLGVPEVELVELRQPSRQPSSRRRRRHEGGEALVTERVAWEIEMLQRGPPPQGRSEGHQPRVADGGAAQPEGLEPRQGASAQGGGERRGACVAHVHAGELEEGHGRQCARAQPLREPLHAVGNGCAC